MEAADERADAGEVVGIEGGRAVFPFEGGGVAILGAQRESPIFGSGGLAVSSYDNSTVVRENRDLRSFKHDAVVMVAQEADSNQVVLEIGYDVSGGGWQVGEKDVAGSRGKMRCAAGSADDDRERVGVHVGAEGLRCEVEAAGARVCNCCVSRRCGRWVGGWLGWAAASSRW